MEDKLLAFAAKALNISQDEVKETLEQDGGLEALTKSYADHVKTVKDAGYKAAERKVNKSWEEKIRADFDLQSDAQGIALLDEAKAALETKAPDVPAKDVTEAQLKKHPLFLEMESKLQTVKSSTEAEYEKKLATIQEAYQQKELFNEIKGVALAQFESLRPVLSSDPLRAAKQREIFLRELENFNYMKNGEEIILLDKENNRLENETGHRRKFEDVVKNITTQYFDLQAAEPRSSASRTPNEQTTPPLQKPKNEQELSSTLANPALSAQEKQQAIDMFYSAQ